MDEGFDIGDMFYIVCIFIVNIDISVLLYDKLVDLGFIVFLYMLDNLVLFMLSL